MSSPVPPASQSARSPTWNTCSALCAVRIVQKARMKPSEIALKRVVLVDTGPLVAATDTRDFSTYRIPFASPEGLFADF